MVNIVDSKYIAKELKDAGFVVEYKNNTAVVIRLSDNVRDNAADVIAVQSISDNHDPVAETKTDKIRELKREGLSRIHIVYPTLMNWDDLDLVRDQWLSIIPAARQPVANFQVVMDIIQAGKNAAAVINTLNTVVDIENYDVVNTPVWP